MVEVSPSSHDPGNEGSDSTQRPLWLVTLEEAHVPKHSPQDMHSLSGSRGPGYILTFSCLQVLSLRSGPGGKGGWGLLPKGGDWGEDIRLKPGLQD